LRPLGLAGLFFKENEMTLHQQLASLLANEQEAKLQFLETVREDLHLLLITVVDTVKSMQYLQSVQPVSAAAFAAFAPLPPTSSSTPLKPRIRKPRLLVIEDNVIASKVACSFFGNAGCLVDTAMNQTEAMQSIHNNDYDMILTDLGLPDGSGVEITREARLSTCRNHLTPIVVLTAHGDERSKQECLTAGANELLVKPLRAEAVTRLMSEYVQMSA